MGFSLATFNVKDLLEPRHDAKLDWIARMLAGIDADVVALQEIGPPELLAAVLDRLPGRGGYGEPVVGTADARGIRCALVSRLRVLDARVRTAEALPFPVFQVGDPPPFGARLPLRRGVVQARVDVPGIGAVTVLVAHFKSARPVGLRDAAGAHAHAHARAHQEMPAIGAYARAEGAVRTLVWRAAEALYVRGLVDEVLRAEGGSAHVAVAGDLNDVPGSLVVRLVQGRTGDDALLPLPLPLPLPLEDGELLDCAARIEPAARFSILHDGQRTQIDHVLVTAGLYARLEAAGFVNAELRAHPPAGRDTDAAASPTIDSDHAPLVTRFG